MKNLKKVLAAVLVFAMVLGTNVFAASFPDLDKSSNYAEAVSVLYDLGILTGYTDGTIKADGDITRAEFAAIVCRIKGLENAANSAKGVTAFTDVPADHWASGYINMATQQGIINGMGDGTFAPEENVTFEQAVKMVVAALGYTPKANGMGGYPTGYLAVASQTGVTSGVSGANGVAANRGTVAKLAYNALDVPIMEQTSFGQGSLSYEPGDSILLDSLDLVKAEATIDQIPGSTGSSNNLKADEVKLTVKKHYIAYDGKLYMSAPLTNNTYSDLSWDTTKAKVGTTNAQSYLNKTVIIYLEGAYDDDVTIKAIVEKSGRTEEVSFASEDLYAKYTDTSATDGYDVAFYDDADNSSSYTEVTIDDADFALYVNDVVYTRAVLPNGVSIGTADTAVTVFQKFLKEAIDSDLGFDVVLLNNDTDSEFDVAYITWYTDYVVDTVNSNRKSISDKNSLSITLDIDEKNATFTFVKADGTEASFDDIKEDCVLSIKKGIMEGKKLMSGEVIILDNAAVTGKITETNESDKEVVVNDTTYGVDTTNLSFTSNLKANTKATFYVNARGKIFAMDKSTVVNNMKVAFATKIGTTSGISAGKQIELMNEDGEFVVYDLANKIEINESGSSVTSSNVDFASTASSASYSVVDLAKADSCGTKDITKDSDGLYVINAPIAYDLNSNGEVNKISFSPKKKKVLDDDGYSFTAYNVKGSYNEKTDAVGGVYVLDTTIIFSVDKTAYNSGDIEEDDIIVMKKDGLVDSQDVAAYAVNCNDDSEAKAIFGLDVVNALVANSNLMVVSGVSKTTTTDGESVTRLTGIMNEEEVQVYVGSDTNQKGVDGGTNFAKGDVVVYQSGAGEILKSIVKIYSAKAAFRGNTVTEPSKVAVDGIVDGYLAKAPNGDEVEFYFGYARELRGSNLTLVNADATNVESATEGVDCVVSFKDANFTVYDKFEGKEPSVTIGDISDIEADKEVGETIDGDYVFVRVVDGTATDAVIIKTDKD